MPDNDDFHTGVAPLGPELATVTRAATQAGSSVVEHARVEVAEAVGVGEDVDGDDLPAGDREAHDRHRLSMRCGDDSGDSVHHPRLRAVGDPGEGERLPGHGRRAVDLRQSACGHGAAVGAEHHVGGEDGEERGEVTAARGGQEGVDDLALAGQIGIGTGAAPVRRVIIQARRTIAVAGATGRVGRHVVDVLTAEGHDIVAMSRSGGVDAVSGDGLAAALAGVECVIDILTCRSR